MARPYISLQPSESAIMQAAATIYAGYVTAGRVEDDEAKEWLKRCVAEAVLLARVVDENVTADAEL